MIEMIEFLVSDIKQYAYCPRIVYYRCVVPVGKEVSVKMRYGKVAHEQLEALERRRKLARYGLATGERLFDQWLRSQSMGLCGKLDLLIRTPAAYYPVDFKFTEGRPRRNHVLQLAAYALLVEEAYDTRVERGFIYLIPAANAVAVEISDERKREVRELLAMMRGMVASEVMPDPTPVRARCTDCEYRNYCADIW